LKSTWKEEYVDSFLDSFVGVIQSIAADKEIKLEKDVQNGQVNPVYEVAVIIGFVGDIKGQANFVMGKDPAMNLTSALAGGMAISEVDDLVKSAIGEFANMVMGGACTALSSAGIGLDITPPSIVAGQDYQISGFIPKSCHKVFISDIGDIILDLAVKQN
jgi:chemotaxis protein CheX